MQKNCAVCSEAVSNETAPSIKDSFYGLQYLCGDNCWDSFEGYYCDRCQLLHDWDTNKTTLSIDDYCAESDNIKTGARI
jgi:hypothetical protein